jgi:pheromone shutdown protein TraB
MITLIGTGHVFNLSSSLIDKINEKQPDLICIELDIQRYNTLLAKQSGSSSYKKEKKQLPLIYNLLARFQDNMAKSYGVNAGDEMLTAINYSKQYNIPLKLIDMNTQNLFIKMLKSMSFSEKIRLILSGFAGMFISKKRVELELEKIEDKLDIYIQQIGEKFPTIKKTLIDERNVHMTKKLIHFNDDYHKIVVCIGDGHIPGISKLLKSNNIQYDIIRLSELMKKETDKSNNTEAYFTTEYKNPGFK